jgi:hypothetical protein
MPPSTEDQLLSLGERVRSLETNMKVAIAIGVILGLGGAAIGTMLMSAGREAKTLQDSTAEMKQQLEKMKSDLPKLLYEPTEAAKKEIEKATELQRLDLKSGLFAATIAGADGTIAPSAFVRPSTLSPRVARSRHRPPRQRSTRSSGVISRTTPFRSFVLIRVDARSSSAARRAFGPS